jgi:mRNA interferase MazF
MFTRSKFRRGAVYWVNLDPTIGSEIKKTRPGVIISNDGQNLVGQRVIVAPATSVVKKLYPFEILIDLNGKKSKVMLDQIRTVDCQRLGEKIGKLTLKETEDLDRALKLVLSLA